MQNNGGPKTFRECMNIPEVAVFAVSLKPHEEAFDAGVAEGRRFERDNQLRDMATAAMTGTLASWDDSCGIRSWKDLASDCFGIAEDMLAESDKRAEKRESDDDKT